MYVPYLTICDLVPILATMIGVEDTDGSVSVVLVHNFPFLSQSTLAGVDIVFPLGKHLLIREPSYTYTDTRKSAYIRVYSPTDLVFLEDDDPILRDVQWKSVFDRKPSLPTTVDGWRLEGLEPSTSRRTSVDRRGNLNDDGEREHKPFQIDGARQPSRIHYRLPSGE